MKAHTIFWLPLALLALAALTPTMKVGSVSQADEQPPPDVSKLSIETPLKIVVVDSLEAPADEQPGAATEPVSKAAIEAAPKDIVSVDSTSTPTEDSSKSTFTNPQVSPGNVRWHDSFADAQAASETSGKPILLFQLLGRLDQRFT